MFPRLFFPALMFPALMFPASDIEVAAVGTIRFKLPPLQNVFTLPAKTNRFILPPKPAELDAGSPT